MPEHSDGPAPADVLSDAPSPGAAPPAGSPAAALRSDPLSAMTPRFNPFFRFFARRFFQHFDLDDDTVERLRELEGRGAVVYVMRYASRLDYFLFNTLFLREGLRLSGFANGIRFWYYRPLRDALRTLWERKRGVPQDVELVRSREYCRELTREGGSFFLFLRTASLGSQFRGRRGAIEQGRQERDLLSEVVASAQRSGRPVHVVPLALFWRKGPRARRRFLNLSYGAPTRPGDFAKVVSFLTTYRGLHVKVGEAIDVLGFAATREEPTPASLARLIRRTLLTYLYREERVVEGPVLQPYHRVMETVVRAPAVQAAVEEIAKQKGVSPDRVRIRAENMFREIAANMSSTFLAVLDTVVGAVIRRMFASVEDSNIDKVTACARRDPVVLVPTHRSYFDFLIISVLFYRRHLVPPHIAARDNMAFGPFGFLWRRAGAFFLRKTFDDPLYKTVFRNYVAYLIKEGFTQEFFIEGARSRTGKMLPPRLGMLSWDVEAFLASGRRDLLFVPVALTYERLVEEGAMVGELEGQQKQQESMLGLMRAWRFLQRRFGSVYVNFGEPLSLAAAIGDRREGLQGESESAVSARREFVEGLGHEIVERINWAIVPHATSVAACALLGERRGLFRTELARRMQQIVDLMRIQGIKLTPALARDEGDFAESIASLVRMDLIRVADDDRGEILYFEAPKRRALDLYRNGILHYLAAPSFLARELLVGGPRDELLARVDEWLDVFYAEFFTPRDERLAEQLSAFLRHFEGLGWIETSENGELRASHSGGPHLAFLADQVRALVEAYHVAVSAIARVEDPIARKALHKRIGQQFERSELLGEAGLPEAANPVTFGNAVALCVRRGFLAPVEGEKDDARDPVYGRGPGWEAVRELRDRLATALRAR